MCIRQRQVDLRIIEFHAGLHPCTGPEQLGIAGQKDSPYIVIYIGQSYELPEGEGRAFTLTEGGVWLAQIPPDQTKNGSDAL